MRKSYLKSLAVVAGIAFAHAGTALADPLVPGKPAGVHAAQMDGKELLVFGGLAAVATAVLITTAASGHDQATPTPITVVNTV